MKEQTAESYRWECFARMISTLFLNWYPSKAFCMSVVFHWNSILVGMIDSIWRFSSKREELRFEGVTFSSFLPDLPRSEASLSTNATLFHQTNRVPCQPPSRLRRSEIIERKKRDLPPFSSWYHAISSSGMIWLSLTMKLTDLRSASSWWVNRTDWLDTNRNRQWNHRVSTLPGLLQSISSDQRWVLRESKIKSVTLFGVWLTASNVLSSKDKAMKSACINWQIGDAPSNRIRRYLLSLKRTLLIIDRSASLDLVWKNGDTSDMCFKGLLTLQSMPNTFSPDFTLKIVLSWRFCLRTRAVIVSFSIDIKDLCSIRTTEDWEKMNYWSHWETDRYREREGESEEACIKLLSIQWSRRV